MRHPFISSTAALIISIAAPTSNIRAAQQIADPTPLPQVAYQGRLLEGGLPVTGPRVFAFSILDSAGIELWNSDNQTLTVEAGLYSVVLGSTGMTSIPASTLSRSNLRLRVSVSGVLLTPDVDIIPAFQARSAWELVGNFQGDLSGTQNATLVMKLQGFPLDFTTPPSEGQALVFSSGNWVPGTVVGTQGATGPQGPAGPAGATGPQGPMGLTGVTGATGAQGPIGLTGPVGPQGPTGASGLNGKTVLNGPGSPIVTGAVGSAGDFYLDTVNSLLYGPKVNADWAGLAGVALIGPQGPQGATGAQGQAGAIGPVGPQGPQGIQGAQGVAGSNGQVMVAGRAALSGSIDPTAGIGADGDFYVNTASNMLFGPKASGAWPVGSVSIIGPQGPQGIQGPQGPQGLAGSNGVNGIAGPQGPQGSVGPVGPQGAQGAAGQILIAGYAALSGTEDPTPGIGVDGDFYVNTTTHMIFGPKVGGAWPGGSISMVGPAGPQGPAGPTGSQGAVGPAGPQGQAGPAGATGAQGIIGLTGAAGATGATGPQGAAGQDGKTLLNGAGSPVATGAAGVVGDFYLDTQNSLLYGPKVGPDWVGLAGVSLVGPQGPQGVTGATGAQGPQGIQGPVGATGLTGATGSQGPTGPTGDPGATGPQGLAGQDGKTLLNGSGSPVSTGAAGVAGDFYLDTQNSLLYGPKVGPDWIGLVGVSLIGPQGPQGVTGATGAQGPQGIQGPIGLTGPQGPQGVQGIQGPIGPVGATGATGPQGLGMVYKGDWNTAVSYMLNDVVVYFGSSYKSLVDNNAHNAPDSDTVRWGMVAQKGDTGATGIQGPQGIQGATGPMGLQGLKGDTGATGAQGIQGPIGPDGRTILSGIVAPLASQGVDGDFYIDTAASLLYGPKAGGLWPAGSSLIGATGATGQQGAKGDTGAQGIQGPVGPQGLQGFTGATGATGATGPIGLVWMGVWDTSVSYAVNEAVVYNGSSYICKVANSGKIPVSNNTYWNTLAQRGQQIYWMGNWAASTTYAQYDGVMYNGSSYTSLQNGNIGNTPDSAPTFWTMLAQGGGVSSVTASSPLASSGGVTPNITLGTVSVSNGGTGSTSLSGYVYGNGSGAMTASTTIPGSALTGTASSLTAGTVTTNANLTGPITSVGNATSIASQTGTGSTFVMSASPTLTGTPLAPTATAGTNNTQLATTAFVTTAVSSSTNASNLTSGTVAVARGGTGTGTAPTQGGVIYANSSAAYASTTAGTTGQVLTSNGSGTPTWSSTTPLLASVNAQTGTTYTVVAGDANAFITLNNASAITLTLPNGLPVGFQCTAAQLGAGNVTLSAAGTLVTTATNKKTNAKGSGVTLIVVATDTWMAFGDMN